MNKIISAKSILAIPIVTSLSLVFSLSSCEGLSGDSTQDLQTVTTEQQQIQALNNLASRTGLFDLRFQNVNSVDLTQSSPPPTTGGENGGGTSGSSGSSGGTTGGLVQVSGTADFYPENTTGQSGTAEPDFIARLNITAVFALSLTHGSQCLADAQTALENGVGFEIIGTGTLVPLPCYPDATNELTSEMTCTPEPIANSGSGSTGTSGSAGGTADITSIIVSPPVVGDPLPPFRTPFAGVDFQSIDNCLVIPTIVVDPPVPQPQPVAQ